MRSYLLSLALCAGFFQAVCVRAATLYVNLNNASSTPPYTAWSTAATNIQDALDAANPGDQILVTNGTYQTGGRVVYGHMTNRVAVTKPVTLQSVNGPGVTVIQGNLPIGFGDGTEIRGVYLTNSASLIGFTVTQGATLSMGTDPIHEQSGGGIWCESTNAFISNCIVSDCEAYFLGGGVYQGTLNNCQITGNGPDELTQGSLGGGAYGSVMTNCILSGNRVFGTECYGGGAYQCVLTGCTLSGNEAGGGYGYAGGAYACTLNNCVLSDNSASYEGAGAVFSTLNNCLVIHNTANNGEGGGDGGGAYSSTPRNCTVTLNETGDIGEFSGPVDICGLLNCIVFDNNSLHNPGNNPPYVFANDPLFVNAAAGDYHLQSGSPCIDSGNNGTVVGATDLDGRPRVEGGTVDYGCYEFQGPFNAWLQQYGLATNGTSDFLDSDGDGLNNWQEFITGTDPTNPLSVLKMLTPVSSSNPPGVAVTWQSVTSVTYSLQQSTNPAMSPFTVIATNIAGQLGTTSYTDTNATGANPSFYRVTVRVFAN